MGNIQRLDKHISNMIAAGEVVERPAGIVKELIENSIDACANVIEINIIQGGILSICIIDNGKGMDKDDALLAFERHATSKIKSEDDLWHIQTMGFRGEALPSIASVSQVSLQTCRDNEAYEVSVYYGDKSEIKRVSGINGTKIEVKNLFQKTPARFKHLKSIQYEFSLIQDIVQKFALSHPEIAFKLAHDERQVFKTSGKKDLREVIMQVFGKEYAQSAIKLEGSDSDYKLSGYAIQPRLNRANKYYMYIFINNRMVRNYRLQKAIIDGYREFLAKDRYPIVVLNISMDAQLVDVNVHPSKWEIRLSKEKQLEKLIQEKIEQAIKEHFAISTVNITQNKKRPIIENEAFDFSINYDKNTNSEKAYNPIIHEKETDFVVADNNASSLSDNFENTIKTQFDTQIEIKDEAINTENAVNITEAKLPIMHVVGQLHGSYILAQGDAGLYIIDQHAAQEKYHYEQIKKKIESTTHDKQQALIPLSIDVDQNVAQQFEEVKAIFSSIDINLELFGERTLLLREIPYWLQNTEYYQFLIDMIDIWKDDHKINLLQLRKHAIATAACHSSIRFNRKLNLAEMQKVIDDLNSCDQPYHCPHGRPTFICISTKDLQKEFERS